MAQSSQYDQQHLESFQSFLQKRTETDLDLVKIVRDTFLQYGLKEQVERYFDTDDYVLQAKDKIPEVQRYLLNIHLTLQLIKAKKSSIERRYGLLPAGPIEDWITVFKEYIVPFMVDENLPTQL